MADPGIRGNVVGTHLFTTNAFEWVHMVNPPFISGWNPLLKMAGSAPVETSKGC